jgi:hypothetical protein
MKIADDKDAMNGTKETNSEGRSLATSIHLVPHACRKEVQSEWGSESYELMIT